MAKVELSHAAFFSDLHLSDQRFPEHEKAFVEILRKLRGNGVQELVLLGDIFDFMVGPYNFWLKRHAEFFAELQNWIAESRKVIWVEGNHDFHLSKLLTPMGVHVVEESEVLGSKHGDCYLAHGDLVNQDNLEYLQWREKSRSKRFKLMLEASPEFIAERAGLWLGRRLSRKSRQEGRSKDPQHRSQVSELFRNFAKDKWNQNIFGVFLGHSHVEELELGPESKFFLNLGSWLDGSAHYALWEPEKYTHPRVITQEI